MSSLDLNTLLDLPVHVREEIWGPGIAQGNLIQVYGPRGISKTRLCMALGMSFAGARKFLKWCAKMRRVLYIDGELGTKSVSSRVREVVRSLDCDAVSGYFRVLPYDSMGTRPWNLSDPRDQQKYEREIVESGAQVVILDNLLTLSRNIHARDNDFLQWERIQPWLAQLRSKGLTVIVVHHTGKSGSQLGTSTKEVILDAVIALRYPVSRTSINGVAFELHYEKTRDFKPSDTPPLLVEYLEGDDGVSHWYWQHLHEDIDERIRTLHKGGLTRAQIAKELGLSFGRVSQVIPKEAPKQEGMGW